jgi:hypothetical protein
MENRTVQGAPAEQVKTKSGPVQHKSFIMHVIRETGWRSSTITVVGEI